MKMSKIITRQRRYPCTEKECAITGDLLRQYADRLDRSLNATVTWEMSGMYDEYEARLVADAPQEADADFIRQILGQTMEHVKEEAGDKMPEDTNIT